MKDEVVKGSNISKTACYMTLAVAVAAAVGTVPGLAEDAVRPGEFVIERPALIYLGFQWYTSGDDNHNAKVTLEFRKGGRSEWRKALDLWRVILPNINDDFEGKTPEADAIEYGKTIPHYGTMKNHE